MTEGDTQLLSGRQTGIALGLATIAATYGLYRLTGWPVASFGHAAALAIGGYLVAAVVLLGINQFVRLAHREYQRLS